MEMMYIFGMISLFALAGIVWVYFEGRKLDHMTE